MTQKNLMQLIQEAKQQIENLTVVQVAAELSAGNVLLVDIRDAPEQAKGVIPGAIHASRGMLEFYADSSSPYYRREFEAQGRVILHCASGGRSALAAVALQELGYTNVAHLDGGINAWIEAGQPIENSTS